MHKWGKFGVMFVDTRGSRSLGFETFYSGSLPGIVIPGHFIGERQRLLINAALKPEGLFGDCQTLIVVNSMPVCYMSTGVASCLECCMKDKMGMALSPDEQGHYLDALTNWVSGGNRDALIVAGDLHFGIRSQIRDPNSAVVLRQMVTSAISNKPPNCLVSCLLRCFCMSDCCSATGGTHHFRHTQKLYDFNYGTIRMSLPHPPSQPKATITECLVSRRSE